MSAAADLGDGSGAGHTTITGEDRPPAEEWDVTVTPYLWALSMDGDARLGQSEADVDVSFSDILEDLNFAVMGILDAHKGRVGYFVNPLVSRVKSEDSVQGVDVDVTNDTIIIAAGLYYRAIDRRFGSKESGAAKRFFLEPYAGARWTYMRIEIDVDDIGQVDKSESWTDPIVGSRMLVDLNARWDLAIAADFGGFGGGSEFSWNAHLLLGYHFKLAGNESVFRFGYRALYQDYETGSGSSRFEWDVTQSGPIAGLTLRF